MSKNELEKIFDNTIQLSYREKVKEIEEHFLSIADGELIVGEVGKVAYPDFFKYKHSFADGIYIREMTMEKGSLVISVIHKHSSGFFLLSGHLAISTENGVEEFIAPCFVVTPRGTKRIGYAIEESVVTTVHKNPKNLRDIEEIDNYNAAYTWEEYEEYIKK
tara:strand:+ start:141 stop:626 length:486 start_codon:yes stop_codon:yes gene_type:complete